jgi:hypothetical protein
MFLGALLDSGIPFALFEKTVADLDIGATLEISRVDRSGISATKLDVLVGGEKDLPREEFWAKQSLGIGDLEPGEAVTASHAHTHSADDSVQPKHTQSYEREHAHDHPASEHAHSHAHARSLSAILKIISAARLSERTRQLASEIFLVLGAAEAKVHNVDLEGIHFHEVGSADAIVDIVCAAVGAEALAVDQFICSPLNVGGGTVACAHGVFPVPAPATLELLQGAPIYSGEIQKELVTPTGAAIVKVLASGFGPRPAMITKQIGYGAGSRDFQGHANVIRISIGETTEIAASAMPEEEQEIAILEANLDDLNPQLIGYIVDVAFAEGALDVFTTPVQMKKNRPGTLLTILVPTEREERMRALLFRESSTLGVRVRREKRYALPRHHEGVITPWGEVRMKVAGVNGTPSQYAPEYEDCRRIAAENHVPLKHVMQEAIRLYLDRQHG